MAALGVHIDGAVREEGIGGKDGGFIFIGKTLDGGVVGSGNVEEVPGLEVFQAMLVLRVDAVVGLEGTAGYNG